MAYIGVQPTDTYLSIASQQITGTGSATYTLDYSVSTEEDVAVFVNNVRQNVNTYTVSGTSLTLGGTISASDSCWILFLGRTVGTKTPAVGSVTNDMLAGSIATSKLADITANGITMADQWRLTTTIGAGTNGVITSNLERADDNSFGYIGTGMTESSGVFSFPTTGVYLVSEFIKFVQQTASSDNCGIQIQVTINNGGGWDNVGQAITGGDNTLAKNAYSHSLVNVTDISQVKVRFNIFSNSFFDISGDSSESVTSFSFIRLGDSV